MLSTGRNQDLPGSVVKVILTLEFGNNGVFQAGSTADRGIFGEPLVNGGDRRILDVLRRVEIRLARAEPDDILAFCLESGRARGNGERRRGLDGLNALREIHDDVLTHADQARVIKFKPEICQKMEPANYTRDRYLPQ